MWGGEGWPLQIGLHHGIVWHIWKGWTPKSYIHCYGECWAVIWRVFLSRSYVGNHLEVLWRQPSQASLALLLGHCWFMLSRSLEA